MGQCRDGGIWDRVETVPPWSNTLLGQCRDTGTIEVLEIQAPLNLHSIARDTKIEITHTKEVLGACFCNALAAVLHDGGKSCRLFSQRVFSAPEGIHLRDGYLVANERSPLSVLIWAELPQVHLP